MDMVERAAIECAEKIWRYTRLNCNSLESERHAKYIRSELKKFEDYIQMDHRETQTKLSTATKTLTTLRRELSNLRKSKLGIEVDDKTEDKSNDDNNLAGSMVA